MDATTQKLPDEIALVVTFEMEYRKPPNSTMQQMLDLRSRIVRECQERDSAQQRDYRNAVFNLRARRRDLMGATRLMDESPFQGALKLSSMDLETLISCLNLHVDVFNALLSYHRCVLDLERIFSVQNISMITQQKFAEERQHYGRKIDEYQSHVGVIQAEIKVKQEWEKNDKMPYNAFGQAKRASIIRQTYHQDLGLNNSTGRWSMAKVLGANQGDTTLWVRYDDLGVIVDRLVKKDQLLSEHAFLSAEHWYGDVRDYDNRIPLEYALQDKCATANPRTFPKVIRWSQDIDHLVVRMYMQYCSHADLQSIISLYYSKIGEEKQPIPEPALWMIFERMVQACMVMRQGAADVAEPGGPQIVHRDIKAPNVFLDLPDSSNFPSYPAPKLGDFGLAIETSASDPFNPRIYAHGAGTRPFYAPEQMSFLRTSTAELRNQVPLLDYTNVFGIGRLMWHLVSGHQYLAGSFQPSYIDETKPDWPRTQFMEYHYSEELIELIYGCTRFKPEERWELSELQARVRDDVEKLPKHLRLYIKAARGGEQPLGDAMFALNYREDEYRIGMATAQ